MKRTFWIFGIAAGLISIVVIVVGLSLGPIVKIGMEEIGSKLTRVSIKVDAVEVSLVTGSAKVKGLIVGNPSGYKTSQAISVGTAAVRMDPFSVLSKKIMVHSVLVESPEVTFEGGLGGNNLSQIMDNVNAVTKSDVPESTKTSTEVSDKPASKIQVDDLLITGAKVRVHLQGLLSKDVTLTLPDIHLIGLGKGSDGLTPAELTRAVFDAINRDTIKAVTGSMADLGQGVQNVGKDARKKMGETVNKITNGMGELFGK